MTGFAPMDRVLVSPVYLAGPGNSAVVTRPLHAAGWSEARTPERRRTCALPTPHDHAAELPARPRRHSSGSVTWAVECRHLTTYTADGTVVEFAVGLHSASRFAWEYEFEVPDSARDQGEEGSP